MNVYRFARTTLLLLSVPLCHADKLLASPGTVPPGACIYALDPAAGPALRILGAQSVYAACGVVVESAAANAFEMEGAETLYLENHAQVSVVGGAELIEGARLWDTLSNAQVKPVQTASPGDPLASIAPPATGAATSKSPAYYDRYTRLAKNTILPGVYCGGITIGNTGGTTLTFSPGTYILAGGGLTLQSQASVTGTGVIFYNTSSAGWGCPRSYPYSPIAINGQVTANLSAPTTGTYNGILFFGNRTGCSTAGSCIDRIGGGSNTALNGALYFASDEVAISGSDVSGLTMLVADQIHVDGNANIGAGGHYNPVSVSPSTVTLTASQTQQFTASVKNSSHAAIAWSISPRVGSISSAGIYTAPSVIPAMQTVTVKATSWADYSKSGTATITLLPAVVTTPTITWPAPAPIIYGTALSAAQLDATASVPGAFAYSPASGTVLAAGLQTLSVTFTPANTAIYTTTTASVTLTVNKATPAIAWATPAIVTYGTALGAAQLDATASVVGTFAYSPAAGTVLTAGLQTLSVTFTPANTTNYTAATAKVSLTVNQATPVITWAAPAAITYGTPLSAAQLDATANVPGTFVYTPASGAVLPAGSQTLSVTFSPTDATDYNMATASVPLTVNSLPISVSVAPSNITLYDGQTLQFTAIVTNGNGAGVTWAIAPSGAGTIGAAGLYAAPSSISAQQTVTVTATSVADTTKSASTTLTLSPAQCGTNGYSYQRAIVINYTEVPNTDQTDFPFLFNSTDPTLASTTNGGHVTSASGYDILFTSDPAGQNILSYEMESYDPVHGQVIAWVRIPTLSHTSDTVLYMFYGNPAITASQQNPAGVWDSNYEAVYHLSDAASNLAMDSTANANSAPYTSVVSAPGEIAGAAGFNGNSSYMQIPGAAFPSYPYTGEGGDGQYTTTDGFAASFEAWFQTTTDGVILGQVAAGTYPNGGTTPSIPGLYIDTTGILRACFFNTTNSPQILSSAAYNDGNWHHAAMTFTNGTETFYVDGLPVGSAQTAQTSYALSYWYFVGAGFAEGWPNTNDYWFYFTGDVDEVSVSNIARSADWIETEFNNQVSPATFYSLYAENGELVVPAVVSLGPGQSQQFTVAPQGACVSQVTWSMNAGAPGTLTAGGLYTAPASIAAQTAVTVTATSIAGPTETGSAFVTLLPTAPNPAHARAAAARSRHAEVTPH